MNPIDETSSYKVLDRHPDDSKYRQLVDSGVPENADTAIAAPASLLPLP